MVWYNVYIVLKALCRNWGRARSVSPTFIWEALSIMNLEINVVFWLRIFLHKATVHSLLTSAAILCTYLIRGPLREQYWWKQDVSVELSWNIYLCWKWLVFVSSLLLFMFSDIILIIWSNTSRAASYRRLRRIEYIYTYYRLILVYWISSLLYLPRSDESSRSNQFCIYRPCRIIQYFCFIFILSRLIGD